MSFHPQAQAAVEEIQTFKACKKKTQMEHVYDRNHDSGRNKARLNHPKTVNACNLPVKSLV